MSKAKQTIVLVGGKSGGPITPLIAAAKYWQGQDRNLNPVIFDVRNSVGQLLAEKFKFQYRWVPSGKLRRYGSLKNGLAPFLLIVGFMRSIYLLVKDRPVIVLGAGGFVQVPVMYAAWALRIPRIIHQQDYIPTLSNLLCAPIANKITTTFEKSVKDFPQGLGLTNDFSKYNKVVWTGNPLLLQEGRNKEVVLRELGLTSSNENETLPTLVVTGGGTGAAGINSLIEQSGPELCKFANVIHLVGEGKGVDFTNKNYVQLSFSSNLLELFSIADIVVSRAGLGTLTELSALGKLAVIIPMPNSHQEYNARLLFEKEAAVVLDQEETSPERFAKTIRSLLFDFARSQKLQNNIRSVFPSNANEAFLAEIKSTLRK